MPPKTRPPACSGHDPDGESSTPCSCPECEVVLPGGLRFSLALGLLQSQGWHLHESPHETVEWTIAAARRGKTPAQRKLGLLYITGKGVPQSYVHAYGWLNLAAAAGDESARTTRDAVRLKMTRQQVAEAQRLSLKWHEALRPHKAG